MNGQFENQFDVSHWAGHILSLFAIVGSFAGLFPAIAALAAVIWYVINIYESRTVQTWVQRRHERRIVALSAKLASLQLRTAARAAGMELKGAAEAAAQTLRSDAKSVIKDAGTLLPQVKSTLPPK